MPDNDLLLRSLPYWLPYPYNARTCRRPELHRQTMSGSSPQTCLHCGTARIAEAARCANCGQKFVKPDEPPEAWIGRTLDGKYDILRILGVGGMGMVFAARRTLVGDEVALKVLYPRLLESPLQRNLFRDEAIASARLSHRNVVTVYDAGFSEGEGVAYIAMELLHGETLKDLLRERAPVPPEDLIPIACQVCDGLHAAHEAKIIHRDLKPDNVFLENVGAGEVRVKLVDFGISAMLDVDRSGEHRQRLGTLRYMSPEQCRGHRVDQRADIYALGVVLYEGLTRRRVTGKSVTAVINEVPAIPNLLLPPEQQLPARLEDVLLRMLAKNPDARPQNARIVRDDMLKALSGEDEIPRPAVPMRGRTKQSPPPQWVPSWRIAAIMGAIGGLLWSIFQ